MDLVQYLLITTYVNVQYVVNWVKMKPNPIYCPQYDIPK